MVTINKNTKLGGYKYPFVSTYKDWRVETHKFMLGDEGKELIGELLKKKPTLRIVKDDGITDIIIGQDKIAPLAILEEQGLVIQEPTHSQTGKRLSRILRPSLAFGTFTGTEMPVHEMDWDKDLWDGMNWISRKAVRLLTAHLPWQVQEAYERCHRFEGTVMTQEGQYKGHFLVSGEDGVYVPKGSAKTQVVFTKGVFVDMRPAKGHRDLWSDIQTTINIYHELWDNNQLLQWLQEESEKRLAELREGEANIDHILANIYDQKELDQLLAYPVFEFLASGGKLHQSPYMTRAWGKMYARKLQSKAYEGHRLPIPCGFRLYLTTAAAGKLRIASGEVVVDFGRASVFVSDDDYVEIAKILGGGDQDDAVNCITDGQTILMSRNPNMRGEYVTGMIVNQEDVASYAYKIDWEKLDNITCIHERTYGELGTIHIDQSIQDYPSFANALMVGVAKRLGVLGKHVNVLASWTLTDGDEPIIQPATGEAVIDGSVKDLTVDLSPVIKWDEAQAKVLAVLPMCRDAIRRISGFVGDDYPFKLAEDHWLNDLEDKVEAHIQWYLEQVQHIADAATPPAMLYKKIEGQEQGKALVAVYNAELRLGHSAGEVTMEDFEAARVATLEYLETLENPDQALLQAWSLSFGSDGAVWQKDISSKMFKALRKARIISAIHWDGYGVKVKERSRPRTNHLQINGTWFNLLKANGEHFNEMRDVPRARRDALKRGLQATAYKLVGRKVTFDQGERTLAYLDNGKFLGFVARDHAAWTGSEATIVHATTIDGNLRVVIGG